MNVGRTGQHQCDQCGRVLISPFSIISEEGGKVVRLCRGTECLFDFYLEGPMRDRVEKEKRQELKKIYDPLCPACRVRVRTMI